MIRLPSKVAALAAGMLMTLACQAQSPTQQPARGDARVVDNAIGAVAYRRRLAQGVRCAVQSAIPFSMLPGVAAAGGKWAVYDYQAGKTVCCLVVVGPEISEAELDSNYGIPGPWITDLVNGWNLDAAPYRPACSCCAPKAPCSTTNSRTWPTSWAACCCPPRRAVAPRTLELDGQRYSVTRKDVPLASDDGMVHAYALRPAQGGKPLAVEVPYGIY